MLQLPFCSKILLCQNIFFVFLIITTFIAILNRNNTVNGIYNPTAKKTNWIDELYKKFNFTGKTYALIFYGRKAQATILLRYLEKNLKVNGGILEKIVFNVKTNNKKDLEYLDSILKQNKSYFEKRVIPLIMISREFMIICQTTI